MTEDKKKVSTPIDPVEAKGTDNPYVQLAIFGVAVAALAIFAAKNPRMASSIAMVAFGFGGVVMIHELGHFLVAKLGGIKVEAFSIGFPPVVLGIRKLKKGFRVRLLPRPGQEQTLEDGDSATEYQVGLVPLGGFVKMLGQSDSGAVEQTDDPHSFLNRPLWIRIAVVAAGVTFNAIAAIILFMGLFLHGIELKPAVVGEVLANSPAYDAGMRPGDEVIEVNGERFVDYEALLLAPALSGKGQPSAFVVRRADGSQEAISVTAELSPGDTTGLRSIGIVPAHKLTIEPKIAEDPEFVEAIFKETGLRPGDEIKALNGQPVAAPWVLRQKIAEAITPAAALTVSRSWPKGSPRTLETISFPMQVNPVVRNFRQAFDLANIYGMVPCLKVSLVMERPQAMGLLQRFKSIFKAGPGKGSDGAVSPLLTGDILIRVGQTAYPNFKELRDITTAYKDKALELTVLRTDAEGRQRPVELTVYPYEIPGSQRVTIGFAAELAMEQAIVAQMAEKGSPDTARPQFAPDARGVRIVAVDGQPVTTFYDVVRLLRANPGQRVSLDYVDAAGLAGGTGMTVPQRGGIHAESSMAKGIPYEELRVTYKAENPIQAMSMGLKKAQQFVVRTVITLYRLIFDDLPSSSLVGPVGIIKVSYTIADASIIHYLYFLGLISSCLAVMNLLPLPVLDGGVIVMLIIEKIKGSPISERVQAVITYAGLSLLLGLMLWVTYNDIIRILFG